MLKTVMIVDDSLIMSQKLSVMLRELGHEIVRVCKDGTDAIRDYTLVRPDLVTMDITMPGIDGIDTMTGIMAINPEARIIMVTSHGQEAMVIRALDAGALGYVLKPVTKEALATMIARAATHVKASASALRSHNHDAAPNASINVAAESISPTKLTLL
jgi:two-component system, chemotaxis family, chemotaxis protein CheY